MWQKEREIVVQVEIFRRKKQIWGEDFYTNSSKYLDLEFSAYIKANLGISEVESLEIFMILSNSFQYL